MKVRYVVCVIFVLLGRLALGQVVIGQQEYQRADIFAGYSYFNADLNNLASRQSLNGWESSFAVNANHWLAAEGDVSGYYKSNVLGSGVNATDYGYLAGPRINYRPAFFHVLFGVDHLSGNYAGSSASQNSFAVAVGGGVQWRVARHWAVRTSADWILTHHDRVGGPGGEQNNFRIAVGFVYTFGDVNREIASLQAPQPAEAQQSVQVRHDSASSSKAQPEPKTQLPAMIPGGATPPPAAESAAPSTTSPPAATIPPLAPPAASAPAGIESMPAATITFQGAIVEFWSRPAGAEVELDGTAIGTSPVRMLVKAGKHTVTFKKQDFQTWQQTFTVTAHDIKVAAYMEQIRYRVTFNH